MFSYGHERNYEMSRPVIGIMGNFYLINDQYPVHASGTMNCEAIVDLCDATPLIIPGAVSYTHLTLPTILLV